MTYDDHCLFHDDFDAMRESEAAEAWMSRFDFLVEHNVLDDIADRDITTKEMDGILRSWPTWEQSSKALPDYHGSERYDL